MPRLIKPSTGPIEAGGEYAGAATAGIGALTVTGMGGATTLGVLATTLSGANAAGCTGEVEGAGGEGGGCLLAARLRRRVRRWCHHVIGHGRR